MDPNNPTTYPAGLTQRDAQNETLAQFARVLGILKTLAAQEKVDIEQAAITNNSTYFWNPFAVSGFVLNKQMLVVYPNGGWNQFDLDLTEARPGLTLVWMAKELGTNLQTIPQIVTLDPPKPDPVPPNGPAAPAVKVPVSGFRVNGTSADYQPAPGDTVTDYPVGYEWPGSIVDFETGAKLTGTWKKLLTPTAFGNSYRWRKIA